MIYKPSELRYNKMTYRQAGRSGLKLPALSLGLWHNFGSLDDFENGHDLIKSAFDMGITHFDLANNYGPPPGSAESTFGKILKQSMFPYRDELIISSKAGYTMWDGPYGDWGSKKYLVSSIDQSLKRMGIDYVDIFYHHRHDPNTPLEETMHTLDLFVRQGKALYVGISNYAQEETLAAMDILKRMGTPFVIHQFKYSMLERTPEDGLLDLLSKNGVGSIAFSPLAQGLLTGKYLNEIPGDSRINRSGIFLKKENLTMDLHRKIFELQRLANQRQQSLVQMALAWLLKTDSLTSVLIGASKTSQIMDSIACFNNLNFDKEEIDKIEEILNFRVKGQDDV